MAKSSLPRTQWGSALLATALAAASALASFPVAGQVTQGQTFERQGELTLRDAIALTINANPRLGGQRLAVEAADARQQQAAQKPAWTAGVDVENAAGTGGARFIRDTETTLRLGTILELGGKRDRRMEVAQAERDLLLTEQDAERLDVLAEVAQRFIDVVARQEFLDAANRQRALAERALSAVRERAAAARSPQAEVARAEIALIQAKLVEGDAQHELDIARATLVSSWDVRHATFGRAVANLYAVAEPPPFETLVRQVDRNPDLLRFATEKRVLDAQVRLAEVGRSPDLSVTGGVRRLEAQNGQALVLSLSMPLGTDSRAEPRIREARAAAAQIGSRERSARAQLHSTLFQLHQKLVHARKVVNALRTEARPKAQSALKEVEQGFRTGRFSLVELTEARRQLLEVERDAVVAAADFHRLTAEAERLTGRSLAP